MIDHALRALIGLMMFLTLLAMGMGLTFAEVVAALRRARILALGIVVNFVAIPALVLLLVKIFAIDGHVAVGLLLCALAPGSGVGPLLVDYAHGDVGLSVGLLLGLTFSSVVLTPILLGWWSGGDVGAALSATTWPTMRLILAFQVVPLIAGLLLRRYAESRTRRAQPWIARIARWLMLGIIAAYLITQGQLLLANGLRPFVVSVIAILASFLVGWAPLLHARTERVALGVTRPELGPRDALGSDAISASVDPRHGPRVRPPHAHRGLRDRCVVPPIDACSRTRGRRRMCSGGVVTRTVVLRRVVGFVRRTLWGFILLGAVILLAWFRLWSPVPVEVVRVERGTVTQEAFGRGTIESQREAAVGFDLVGRLSDVLVEEGTQVSLGQELARLETNQADADLRFAKTGVGAARASLQRLAAEEERARVALEAAEREAPRARTLFASGALPGQQRDEATDRLRLARADLDRVLAQRSEATRGIDVAAGSAEQRRVAMVRATLLAPFDGLVARRLREPGDTVSIGSTVLRIVDTRRAYVSAAIDETVLPQLAVDQRSAIFFPGETVSIEGRVTRISWESDRQTHELIVEITPDRFGRRVAIGQRADVRIELARRERALRVPIGVLHHDETGAYVYVDRGARIAVVRPRFGLSGIDYVEVLDGLSEGDTILNASGAGTSLPVGRRWRRR